MKISDIYGKRIRGSGEGYVVSVNWDGVRLTLVCADANEREFCVPFDGASFGEEIIYYGCMRRAEGSAPVRLGRAAFDENGMYLGNLEEVTIAGGRPKTAKIGKKNYPFAELAAGDIIIVKSPPKLKRDVVKGGRTLFAKGTPVTGGVLEAAAAEGEYVQTKLKTL